ncbi:MAG TPA: ATP-binding cassette domain-containing protein, partial [Acidimicrobiales bacterium]
MISAETAVWIDDLSVAYRRHRSNARTVRDAVRDAVRLRVGSEPFWALRNVSARVKRGEVLGVVGANGSGKSTLLKALARVLPPSGGRVVVRGRV